MTEIYTAQGLSVEDQEEIYQRGYADGFDQGVRVGSEKFDYVAVKNDYVEGKTSHTVFEWHGDTGRILMSREAFDLLVAERPADWTFTIVDYK